MNLRNLRIGTRLGVGFASILLAAGAMLALSLAGSKASRGTLQAATVATASQAAHVTQMQKSLLLSALAVRSMGLQSTVEGVQKDEADAKKHRKDYLAERTALAAAALPAEVKALLDKLATLDKASDAAFTEAVDLAAQFNSEQAAKVILTRIDPLVTQSLAAMDELVRLQQADAARAMGEVEASHGRMVGGVLAGSAVMLALAALFGWRLSVSITVPLRQAVHSAARVAQGDLKTEVPVSGRDEAAQLLQALREMRDSLAGMVRSVREGSDTIGVASSEIAQGNADLSARTESQAGALQQTASSVEHLTLAVRGNADSAAQALGLARTASQQSDSGHDAVARVVETMGEIQGHSRRIGDIITVINSIAFQTNILALNAAVEAARAGEQGRGFAVVASEVRSLSQRTTSAAKEIEGLIRAAADSSEAGVGLVQQAGQAITEVRDSVRQVSALVEQISAGSRSQTEGISEVNRAIGDIDRGTQQNAALVEQAAAAAESMRQQTQRLNGLVSAFDV